MGTPTPTYAIYNKAAFEKLPSVALRVMGKDITFLADGGATVSLI